MTTSPSCMALGRLDSCVYVRHGDGLVQDLHLFPQTQSIVYHKSIYFPIVFVYNGGRLNVKELK